MLLTFFFYYREKKEITTLCLILEVNKNISIYCALTRCTFFLLPYLSFFLSLCSPGGFGLIQKSQTSGITASMIMPLRLGCVRLPLKTVKCYMCVLVCLFSGHFFFVFLHDLIFHTCLKLLVWLVSQCLTLMPQPSLPDWLQSVQALMVLSVFFSSISFLFFLGQLLTLSKGGLFYFTGLCQAFAGVWRTIPYKSHELKAKKKNHLNCINN